MSRDEIQRMFMYMIIRWPYLWPTLFPRAESTGLLFSIDTLQTVILGSMQRCMESGIPGSGEEMVQRLISDIRIYTPAISPTVVQYVELLASCREPSEAYCVATLNAWCAEQAVGILQSASTETLSDSIVTAQRLTESPMAVGASPVDIIGCGGVGLLTRDIRPPSGLFFFDEAMGGLPEEGSMCLNIMPTKSGKTALSIHLSACMIATNPEYRIAYFNFEQKAKGDLVRRIYAHISQSSLPDWADVLSVEEQSRARPEIAARFYQNSPAWARQFAIFDRWAGVQTRDPFTGIPSLDAAIERRFPTGTPQPTLVILDWWRNMWEQVKSRMNIRGEGAERKAELQFFLSLKEWAVARGTRLLVHQQMATAATKHADKLPKIHASDGAENKALVQYADAVWVSTRKVKNIDGEVMSDTDNNSGYVGMKLDLFRGGNDGWARWLRMNGPRQMFEPHNRYSTMETLSVSEELIDRISAPAQEVPT